MAVSIWIDARGGDAALAHSTPYTESRQEGFDGANETGLVPLHADQLYGRAQQKLRY
jgi:hypothetical protein